MYDTSSTYSYQTWCVQEFLVETSKSKFKSHKLPIMKNHEHSETLFACKIMNSRLKSSLLFIILHANNVSECNCKLLTADNDLDFV